MRVGTCMSLRPTILRPRASKRRTISPTRPRWTPSGLTIAKVRSVISRLGLGSRGLLLGCLLRGLRLVGRRGAGLLLEVRRPADVAVDALEADHVLLALVGAEVQLRAVLLDVELARAGLDVVAAEAAGALVDHRYHRIPSFLASRAVSR